MDSTEWGTYSAKRQQKALELLVYHAWLVPNKNSRKFVFEGGKTKADELLIGSNSEFL